MVGNEGMAGMPFILGMGVSGVRAIVQGGGNALRMAAGPFRIEFDAFCVAGSAVPLHVCPDGTNLADRSLQPLSRSGTALSALAIDDPRPGHV